jgi:hypothetical protein
LSADQPSSNGATARPRYDGVFRFIVLGYIVAIAMPPIGLVLGIVLSIRSGAGNRKHGVGIIVVSAIAAVVWILIIAAGGFTSTSDGY